MKTNTFNESLGKMRSLMERMGSNMTAYEASLNEEARIAEAIDENRTLVHANNLYDVITTMSRGGYASFGYVMGANLNLPIIKKKNPATNRIKNYVDNEALGSKLNYPADKIGGIVKFTRYLVHWDTPESIGKKYGDYKTGFNNICDEYGCSDAKIKDKEYKTKEKINYGDNGFEHYSGNDEAKRGHDYSSQNLHGAKIKSTYLLVDVDGNIIREVNKNEIKEYIKPKSEYGYGTEKIVKALKEIGTEEAKIKEVIDKVNSLNMRYQTFLLHSILYIVGATKNSDGGLKKIIFLNDGMKDIFGDVKINANQLRDKVRQEREIDLNDVVQATETDFSI
jgi:hypothetical protein